MSTPLTCTCVVAGGGPAGVMAGFLLARAGVDTIVLEKHADFFRDFRGDTIHPSTLQVMAELGLLDEFLKVPHDEVRYGEAEIGEEKFRVADLSHLPTRCKFIAFMPQWDFLNFMAAQGKKLPRFRLMMDTEATDLVRQRNGQDDRFVGLTANAPSGPIEIRADLVIGADGRHSRLRDAAGLEVDDIGAPMDVLWLRLERRPGEDHAVLGRFIDGRFFIMLDRHDYWQCGLIIRKGTFDVVKNAGIAAFRTRVAQFAKRDNVDEIKSFDDVKLLTVAVDRLREWSRPGLLFIGDAAHAMSPIGGVGVNLAVQDAVAAANILGEPLRRRAVTPADLHRVQKRRSFPTWATQTVQVTIQNRVIDPMLASGKTPKPPALLRLMQHWPWLQRIPARVLGLGFRPEHVRTSPAP
ncbi:MAG TPA: FAD-dependent oxidoreductase [Xanthobacteraceae bacterium]|nr:FAD-dependent oxidoreductase [Xanthobacteraceae bacterium]